MRSFLLASALAAASALPAFAQDIGGHYTVEGTNFDGTPYSGEAEIKLLSATTCAIEWTTAGATTKGVCMRNDDAFAASYTLDGETGLVVYKTHPDGSMEGLWTLTGKGGNGTENLKPK